jgi:hypothetical protein
MNVVIIKFNLKQILHNFYSLCILIIVKIFEMCVIIKVCVVFFCALEKNYAIVIDLFRNIKFVKISSQNESIKLMTHNEIFFILSFSILSILQYKIVKTTMLIFSWYRF